MIAGVLLLAGASLAPVVLRGEAEIDPRPVRSIDARGVLLGARGDAPEELFGWERVKLVVGDDAPRAAPFMPIAENAWRARERLLRSDSKLALPQLESLATAVGEDASSAALIAWAGLTRARADADDLPGAARAWEKAVHLLQHGQALDEALARALRFDAERAVLRDVPVFWEAGAPGNAWVDTLRRTVHGEAAERTAGRAELFASLKSSQSEWVEAWTRAAIGRSYLREPDADARILGILELLHVPARFSRGQPMLSALCIAAAADEAQALGDSSTVQVLRRLGDANVSARPQLDPAKSAADQLGDYLETSGLTTLLASHLDAELRVAEGITRARLAQRLARLYAQLLEAASDQQVIRGLEERARALLDLVPDADSLDLRLTLARSTYARAEQDAERWRLRLNSRADADAARRVFIELEPQFADLAIAADRRVDSLEKQEESSTGSGADRSLLAAALVTVRRTRSMGHFLAGWCAYYAAELDPASAGDAPGRAERHFGWLLNARADTAPSIERVPESLLEYEHVARAALGVAMCHSLRGQHEQARRWIDLLVTRTDPPPSVQRAVRVRRLVMLARAGDWAEVSAVIDPRGAGPGAAVIEPLEVRLLAVLALEARHAGVEAAPLRPLIIFALEYLAGHGETQQVLDLASRYFDRVDDIAPGGFLPAYIRGLREFDRADRARKAAGERDDRPPADPETRRVFAQAMKFFGESLASSDASEYESAIPGITLLDALARFYSAESAMDLAEAAGRFEKAAEKFELGRDPQAARAALLAIRALDAAGERSRGDTALAARRRILIDRFLEQHPAHPSASALLYERALSGGRSPAEAARDLLSIADDSPVAYAAHYQASRLLYDLFLAAAPGARDAAALEFLSAAEPLLEQARRARSDADTMTGAISTARRILDCLLKLEGADPARARKALDFLVSTAERGVALSPGVPAEIEYRAVQIALLENDWNAADHARARLRAIDSALAAAAGRAIYQRAADLFEQADPASAERHERARDVMRMAQVVLDELPAGQGLSDPAVATVYATFARAASESFAQSRDARAGAIATECYAILLAAYPSDSNFLRGAAEHATRVGDAPGALSAWRGLLAGLPQGSEGWFDALVRIVEILGATDPEGARAALARHRILFPDLGPEPWRSRLLEAERRIGARGDAP